MDPILLFVILTLLTGLGLYGRYRRNMLIEQIARLVNTQKEIHTRKEFWKQQTANETHKRKEDAEHWLLWKQQQLQEAKAWKITAEKEIRKDANQRSRATIRGQATEHLAPYMMEGSNPKDWRFIGDPVDYLVCSGSSGIKDGTTNIIDEVILLDIKTGNADLSKTQRRIRNCIVDGKMRFTTFNPDTSKTRTWTHECHTPSTNQE